MNPIKNYINSIFFPHVKRCKKWTVYRVPKGQKTLIAANFEKEELSDLRIPKATINFYAIDADSSLNPNINQ